MLDNFVLIQYLVQNLERTAAADHIVFGDDFEPIDHRLLGENVVVVRHSQSNSNTVIIERVKPVCGHNDIRLLA
jgi:hypothetical protein